MYGPAGVELTAATTWLLVPQFPKSQWFANSLANIHYSVALASVVLVVPVLCVEGSAKTEPPHDEVDWLILDPPWKAHAGPHKVSAAGRMSR